MKRTHSLFALGVGLVGVAVGGAMLTVGRTAEAASSPIRFARPLDAAPVAAGERAFDLKLYSSLTDHRQFASLAHNLNACHAALAGAGVSFVEQPAVRDGACGYGEALKMQDPLVRWRPNPGAPSDLPMTCALAAKLHMWERHVVIPAAEKHLGSPVTQIRLLGTFQCRNVAGTEHLSEHSFAKAADIAGFVLADGRQISVLGDFRDKGAKGAFLREIHDRACDVFDVTLGPDYNADHANHFHVDVGGDYACR